MRAPRFSSFTVIGVILLGIGIYGLVQQHRGVGFEFDPGMPAEPGEAWYYIFVGLLMIVNGYFWMKQPASTTSGEEAGEEVPADKAAVGSASTTANNARR